MSLLTEVGTDIASAEIAEVAALLTAKEGADPVELVAVEVREYREGMERAAELAKRIHEDKEPEELTTRAASPARFRPALAAAVI